MTLDELRAKHRDFILKTAAEHGVSDVRVFGSVARGDADEHSDVDLLVKLGEKTSLLTLARLERLLGETVGMPFQVITEGGINPLIEDRIFGEAESL